MSNIDTLILHVTSHCVSMICINGMNISVNTTVSLLENTFYLLDIYTLSSNEGTVVLTLIFIPFNDILSLLYC